MQAKISQGPVLPALFVWAKQSNEKLAGKRRNGAIFHWWNQFPDDKR
jgi:hypothetical protein